MATRSDASAGDVDDAAAAAPQPEAQAQFPSDKRQSSLLAVADAATAAGGEPWQWMPLWCAQSGSFTSTDAACMRAVSNLARLSEA